MFDAYSKLKKLDAKKIPSTILKLQTTFFLKIKQYIIIQSRSFCASPSCRPRLRLGVQSLGLAQKDSLLLLMV
jgi:hypothetical protein